MVLTVALGTPTRVKIKDIEDSMTSCTSNAARLKTLAGEQSTSYENAMIGYHFLYDLGQNYPKQYLTVGLRRIVEKPALL
jgi:hypothetical protein